MRDTLTRWECDGVTDSVVFLLNELVTNAVLHAPGPMTVRLRRLRARIRCEVCDGSIEQPAVRSYAIDDLTGRGLALVVAMAANWGVETHRAGKCVWFEVDL